jgi:ABC-type multidrug transport system permease subunit
VEFFAPGLIVTLAVFNSNFTGFQLLNDINFGVIEKVLVTPANRYALILGTVLYVAVTGVLQIIVVLLIAHHCNFWFSLAPVRFSREPQDVLPRFHQGPGIS